MNIQSRELITALNAKYNELEGLKKYVEDQKALQIITAKQDTIEDVIEIVNAKEHSAMMAQWD